MEDEKRIENEVTSDTSSASGASGEDVYTEGDDSEKGISARRKKNQALSDEDLKEMAAKLFKGDYDYNKGNSGCYKGYYLKNSKSPIARGIIDTLEESNAEIKLCQSLEDGESYIQLLVNGEKQEMMLLSQFDSAYGDNKLKNRRITIDKSDLGGRRDFVKNFTSMSQNINFFHSTIGFTQKCDLFKGINIIPLGIEKDGQNKETVQKMLESEFMPNDKLEGVEHKGDLETFKKGIQELVKPYPLLVLSLAVGVYGVVLQWLKYNDKIKNNEQNMVLNFAARKDVDGASSSFGKSVASKLMLAMFGEPEDLTIGFNTTSARRDEILRQLGVVPLCISDFNLEVNNKTNSERANIIRNYVFGGVSGKTREVYGKKSVKYYAPLVTSTEESLIYCLAVSGAEMGSARRLLEISCESGSLTKDKEHSDAIEELVGNNHGFIDEFIKSLYEQGIGIDAINEEIKDSEKNLNKLRLFDNYAYNNIGEAWIKRLAIIATCIELLNKAFGFEGDDKLNCTSVIAILVKNIGENLNTYNQCRNMSKELNADTSEDETYLYWTYINNIYNNYNRHKDDMFKQSKDVYKETVIKECEKHAADGNERKRKEILAGCIGFENITPDCEDRHLFVRGEKNMKWLMGIENESNDVFKSVVRMLLRNGAMIRGNGQGENANTVKLKISKTRTNYYAINLDVIESDRGKPSYDLLGELYESEGDIVDIDDEQEGDEE